MVVKLQTDSLREVLTHNEKTLVMYTADWCGACKQMNPTFEKYARENPHIPFIQIDSDASPIARDLIDLTHIPTFVAFIGSEPIAAEFGTNPKILDGLLNLL